MPGFVNFKTGNLIPEDFVRVFLNNEMFDPFGRIAFAKIGVFAGMFFAVAIKLAPILSVTNCVLLENTTVLLGFDVEIVVKNGFLAGLKAEAEMLELGVALGVGEGVTVGLGLVGVGVGVIFGIGGAAFNFTSYRLVPETIPKPSTVNLPLTASPVYSRLESVMPTTKTRIRYLPSATLRSITPSVFEHCPAANVETFFVKS
jgi:hypothetical protein